MKHTYGSIVKETSSWEAAAQAFNTETSGDKMEKGDFPEEFNTDLPFTYVLVVNSDNFLDCEYRLSVNSVVYTREEFRHLTKYGRHK